MIALKRISLLAASAIIAGGASGQSSSVYDELDHLSGLIHEYMSAHDSSTHDRDSEFIILFMPLDSSGHITTINIMRDDKVEGLTYRAIKNIQPHNLSKWHSAVHKNKLLVMPVYTPGSTYRSYIDSVGFSPMFSLTTCRIKGNYKFLICQQLFYLWPSTQTTYCPTIPTTLIEIKN